MVDCLGSLSVYQKACTCWHLLAPVVRNESTPFSFLYRITRFKT